MKSSENISLVYIFPEKIWLPIYDILFLPFTSHIPTTETQYKSAKNVRRKNAVLIQLKIDMKHNQNTIQIYQKCKEEKYCSNSAQN